MKAKAAATGERMVTLDVSLLGREYKVACKEGEEAELNAAVAFLDGRMREIRAGSKASTPERVAVMTALNLAHDFQRGRAAAPSGADETRGPAIVDASAVRRRIASMRSAIDQVLAVQEKLL